MPDKTSLAVTILSGVYVGIGFAAIVFSVVLTKNINTFNRSEESKDADMMLYFIKASCVYLMVAGAVCMMSGSLGMVGSLLERQWSMMLYFMTLLVSLIIWFMLEGIFGMVSFGLTASSDAMMSATIQSWEIRFHCCGWKTLPSDASKCAYPQAFATGHTCIKEFSSIISICLGGFIGVALLAIYAIGQMILACFYYRKLKTNFSYSYKENQNLEHED
ncbi:hypothetical protein EIN_371310 [Entamoeba invadens IP1]|uniref:Uncharacterized protein n=1 Tax=Entamoeba invadens IP1 TaxID=370355 RepID=A0A0A1UFK1_ENTIV|nr:hypothetical protein EIN_371310 [Entamoeba invadens IP1]ELP92719.1 hypothetical protein EIN_371310 [Entamoeba invadens IP1]|eukprot:XP_004259490.1 hypothetical protein EIN_371310 [Entamoeba invadens IP1]